MMIAVLSEHAKVLHEIKIPIILRETLPFHVTLSNSVAKFSRLNGYFGCSDFIYRLKNKTFVCIVKLKYAIEL